MQVKRGGIIAVYVDELQVHPNAWGIFKKGSSHMTADTSEELHVMAEKIGMKRSWFQDGRIPHYDLVKSRRDHALRLGAVFKPAREQARERMIKEGRLKPKTGEGHGSHTTP